MSSNSGVGLQSLLPENILKNINGFFTNNKTLDFLIHRGKADIPYGFMGIATAAVGTFTYVTYKDYANEISSGISETLDTIQSTELFIPSENEEESLFPMDKPDEQDEEIVNDDIVIASEEPVAAPQEETEDESTVQEKEPSAPEESEKKEEPGEKYKMGGKSKKRRKTKKKKTKSKRKV